MSGKGVDAQRSKADRVCSDAMVADASYDSLHRDGPFALAVQVPVNASSYSGPLESLDTGTRP